MRSIAELIELEDRYSMTPEENYRFEEWLLGRAREYMDSYEYCVLLGWWRLGERIPISPKEAGID